jgi:hypothetical protein
VSDSPETSPPRTFENLGRKLDERPEVQAAEKALRAAQEQLDRARRQYQEARTVAAETLDDARGRNTGDWISVVLEMVRKYPAPGVMVALACGWLAGRLFRR